MKLLRTPYGRINARAGLRSRLTQSHDAEWTNLIAGCRITFYAAAGGRVFKSTDGGKSWRPVGDGLPEGVSVVAVAQSDPQVVYAGALSRSGVILFRSGDGGESWEVRN
jgi:photosystem II stability/assembly factor-like uncharacterized protein